MCFAAVQPFIVYLCPKRISALSFSLAPSLALHCTCEKYPLRMVSISSTEQTLIRCVYACVCHLRFGKYNLCTWPSHVPNAYRSSAIQIVRDLVHLLEQRQIAASFQHATVYCMDLTIIFEFLNSLNSLPPKSLIAYTISSCVNNKPFALDD